MEGERVQKLEELINVLTEQFIVVMKNNNALLLENLRLMKENDALRNPFTIEAKEEKNDA